MFGYPAGRTSVAMAYSAYLDSPMRYSVGRLEVGMARIYPVPFKRLRIITSLLLVDRPKTFVSLMTMVLGVERTNHSNSLEVVIVEGI
jgi:hypothetical protein